MMPFGSRLYKVEKYAILFRNVCDVLQHVFERSVQEPPTFQNVWVPIHIRPRIPCAMDGIIGITHGAFGADSEHLRHVVGLQPSLELRQRHPLRIGLEQPVVLHALEHDEPVPVFAHQDITIRHLHTLYACEDSNQNLVLYCFLFGFEIPQTDEHFVQCLCLSRASGSV